MTQCLCIISDTFGAVQNPEPRTLGLHTPNPGLRKVDLEPSPKRGSDKIHSLRPRTQQKTSRIVQPGHTNENPALREVDL